MSLSGASQDSILEGRLFFPPETKLQYIRDMFTEMDYKAEMKANYKNGFAAGEAKGEARGEARGRSEGRSEGERLKAIDSATKLRAAGIPVETIAACVGLSVEEVNALK